MKLNKIKNTVLVFISLIIISSCSKNEPSQGGGLGVGPSNTTNLALTNDNISGSWLATGNSTSDFTSFTFSNNVDFSIEYSNSNISTGTYTIIENNKIALSTQDTIEMTTLSATAFNFTFKTLNKDIKSIFNITTELDNGGNNGSEGNITSSGDIIVDKGVLVKSSSDSYWFTLTDGSVITDTDGSHYVDYNHNYNYILEIDLDSLPESGSLTFYGWLNPNCFNSSDDMNAITPYGSNQFTINLEDALEGNYYNNGSSLNNVDVSPGSITVTKLSGANEYKIDYSLNLGTDTYCEIVRSIEGSFSGVFYYDEFLK